MDDEQKEGCAMLIFAIMVGIILATIGVVSETAEKRIKTKPEILLTTDGDTVYVYKLKQE